MRRRPPGRKPSPPGAARKGIKSAGEASPPIAARKRSHLRICLEENVTPNSNDFDRWRLLHNALPELDCEKIDTGATWLGRRLELPLLIASMTGGAARGGTLNARLARAAQRHRVAFALGSGRILLEDPRARPSFDVRGLAPDVPLLANLGAVQLNYGVGLDECRRLCQMLRADALVLHLNPMQEAIQPGGDRNFAGLLPKIARVVGGLGLPVVVKEVGCGISAEVARRLVEAGVRHLDVSGRGGTSWPWIEARNGGPPGAEAFAGWGIPTPEALRAVREVRGVETLIAGGGLRGGLDLAKALALGAHLGSFALAFARAAHQSEAALDALVVRIRNELRLAMFGVGAGTVAALRRAPIVQEGAHGR